MAATLERFSLYSKCGIIVHRRFYCEVLLANFAAENRTARRTYATLSGYNLAMIVGGLLALLNLLAGNPQMSLANAGVGLPPTVSRSLAQNRLYRE